MRSFPCETKDCNGTAAPTDEGRVWAFGVQRVWTCPMCERRYLVGER